MKLKRNKRHVSALALLLVLCMAVSLFAGCNSEPANPSTEATQATEETKPSEPANLDNYVVYWNKDRAQYEGKAEDGMSTGRATESDGFVHIDLVSGGKVTNFRVKSKRIATTLDSMDLFVIEQDSDGVITGATNAFDVVPEVVANMYYVTEVSGNTVKTNTSESLKGMKINFTLTGSTKVMDVSGETVPFGAYSQIRKDDRVTAIANSKGEVTDVFIVTRVNNDVEQLCSHCNETVVFKSWDSKNTLPISGSGHFILLEDVYLNEQQSMQEGANIILDLNGKSVVGAAECRVYSIHNDNTYLAILDSSEAKTGKISSTGTVHAHGTCVWARKGNFDFYSGTLFAGETVSTAKGGAVQIQKGMTFNMYGGTIIGAYSVPVTTETGSIYGGQGGSVHVEGTFNMYGGLIKDGKVESSMIEGVQTHGQGGNIYVANGGVFNMTGGEITGGSADNGEANVHVNDGGVFNKSEEAKVG